MKKHIFTYIFILHYLIIGAQTIKNPELEFHSLELFHFENYDDHYITYKHLNREKKEVIDTIYSCKYDDNNRIIKKRYNSYENYVDGTTLFSYDNKGRLSKTIFYHQTNSYNQNKYNLNEVNVSLYHYNTFDSISSIELYCGRRISLPNITEVKDSVCSLIFGEFTDKWRWSYIYDTKYEYDSLNNLIKVYSVIPANYDYSSKYGNITEFILNYQYDSLNRVIYEAHNTISLNGLPVDSNSFNNYKLVYNYYSDSLIIANINSEPVYPYIEMKIKYDSIGNVIEKIKTYLNYDGPNYQTNHQFYYENNKIIKEIRTFDQSPNSQEFNYFYKKGSE